MGVTIVVGGQFGGEGKGKVVYELGRSMDVDIGVKVGGTNCGHTVMIDHKPVILRQLPTTALLNDSISIIAAGSYIDLDLLFDEMKICGIGRDQVFIDPNAVIISKEHKIAEQESGISERIGAPITGSSEAIISRIKRIDAKLLASNCEMLQGMIYDTKKIMRRLVDKGGDLIIEGSQGYGSSLLHTTYYPYCTSRDTTAAAFLSEAGLSPFDVTDIVMCIRSFPIRMGGHSGELPNETNWDSLSHEPELTSVNRDERRVGAFDPIIVNRAIEANKPSKIVLNHMDYVIEKEAKTFLFKVENSLNRRVDYLGFGPESFVPR